jgi:hypothetical protein
LLKLRATWPTFNKGSLHTIWSEAAFRRHLHDHDAWHKSGLHWRSRFLLTGEVYREEATGFTYRIFGGSAGCALAQRMLPARAGSAGHDALLAAAASKWPSLLKLPSLQQVSPPPGPSSQQPSEGHCIPHCWQHAPSIPEWVALLDWDDFTAVPTTAISPLGLVARGLGWASAAAGIVLLEDDRETTPLNRAARLAFKGLRAADLGQLAKERGVKSEGCSAQRTKTSITHASISIHCQHN